jgi:hypothetical protein
VDVQVFPRRVRFTRRVTPNPSDPTLSATSLAQTSAASSFPPKPGAAANSCTARVTASDVRRFVQSRMGLTGRGRLPAPAKIGDFLVWAYDIRARLMPAKLCICLHWCTIRCTMEGAAAKCAECPKCHMRYVFKQDSSWIGKRPARAGNEHRLF